MAIFKKLNKNVYLSLSLSLFVALIVYFALECFFQKRAFGTTLLCKVKARDWFSKLERPFFKNTWGRSAASFAAHHGHETVLRPRFAARRDAQHIRIFSICAQKAWRRVRFRKKRLVQVCASVSANSKDIKETKRGKRDHLRRVGL